MKTETCAQSELLTKIPFSLFLFYKVATFVPALIALYAIVMFADTILWTGAYVAIFLVHVAIVYRIKCTHCTYYQLPGEKLQCMWLWGTPKVFPANTGPESPLNKLYVPFGMAVVALFPVYWLRSNWVLLVLYFAAIAVLVASLFMFTCSRCTYFGCSHNRVPVHIQDRYRAGAGKKAH